MRYNVIIPFGNKEKAQKLRNELARKYNYFAYITEKKEPEIDY